MGDGLKYRIRFTKGSLAGQLFPLGTEAVTVGRSHTCGIRLMEPDVSGRHVLLAVGPKGVAAEVISSRRTLLDGKALKTGDTTAVKAGQTISMGGSAAFVLECYRNDGDETEAPGDLAGGMTRFDAAATDGGITRRPGSPALEETSLTEPSGRTAFGGDPDDGDGTEMPVRGRAASRRTSVPPPSRRVPPVRGGGDATRTGTLGTQVFPPSSPGSGGGAGDTLGTEAMQPSPDATQVLQTRAATPQELAYMRELHNRKRRRRTGLRLAMGVVMAVLAGALYVWMAMHAPEQVLTSPGERKRWPVVDRDLKPLAASTAASSSTEGGGVTINYPAPEGIVPSAPKTHQNAALGVMETVFTVETRVGRDLDVPLRLRLVVYESPASLNQSQEAAFGDWDRTEGQAIEKQRPLQRDFLGVNPGLPCLRYTYTRKATDEEESKGILDWAGVLSFFRLRDTCFVYFREVPSVEELRAERMLSRTGTFLWVTPALVRERWAGMDAGRQYAGDLGMLRNSAEELIDKNMDTEWEELEDKLTTILVRTYLQKGTDPEADGRYKAALGWMTILRDRQTETWKKQCLIRFRAERDKYADKQQMDEEVRALFRSRDDRRYDLAQKKEWWKE